MKIIVALTLLALVAFAAQTSVDLSPSIKSLDGSDTKQGDTGASTNVKAAQGTAAPAKDISSSADGVQTITATVGDTVSLQLDEPVDGKGLTWDIVE